MPIFYLFVAFILAPKIDLIPFGGASLRAEDFIWAAAMALCVYRAEWRNLPRLPGYMMGFIAYVGLSILSFAINVGDAGPGGLFYIVRQVQYFTWGLMALAIAPRVSRDVFVKHLQIVSWILTVWGVLELLRLVPKIGKFIGAAERLTINTTGPFETSVVLLILAFAARTYVLQGALLVLTFLTQARITIVGGAIAFMISRPRQALIAAVVGAALIGIAPVVLPVAVGSRLSETQSPQSMYEILDSRWKAAPVFRSRTEYMSAAGFSGSSIDDFWRQFQLTSGDLSFQFRAYRWSLILKTWIQSPAQILLGFSPGYFGNAVDSSMIRLLAESGLIGGAAYLSFIFLVFRSFKVASLTWPALIGIVITALFIDIFWSSKVMTLFWVVSSWEYASGLSLSGMRARISRERPASARLRVLRASPSRI